MDEKDAGQIIGKGFFEEQFLMGGIIQILNTVSVHHTIKIIVKDGRYKFEITDFSGTYYRQGDRYLSGGTEHIDIDNSDPKHFKKSTMKFREKCHKHVLMLIDSLKKNMAKAYKKDDF
jgi:hypothetical protein